MNIYQFQNCLYLIYKLKNRLENRIFLYIENKKSDSNVINRAIGEETSNFLKDNKEYIIQPWLKQFDD